MPSAVRKQEVFRRKPSPTSQCQHSTAGCCDLGAATLELRPLLRSVIPPNVELEVETMPCPGVTRLTREDLACLLLHRVRCSAGVMPAGGRLRVTAQYGNGFSFLDRTLFPDAQPENVVITIEESRAKVTDISVDYVPDDIIERMHAAGAELRSSSSPRRNGVHLELEIPVT
jgi:hypothetical protein